MNFTWYRIYDFNKSPIREHNVPSFTFANTDLESKGVLEVRALRNTLKKDYWLLEVNDTTGNKFVLTTGVSFDTSPVKENYSAVIDKVGLWFGIGEEV